MAKTEYLRREGSGIVAVEVTNGLVLPLEHLTIPLEKEDELYFRHPVGGGLVAASSYVPDELQVPYSVIVGPDTRVVSDHGMIGQHYVQGRLWNPGEVGRPLDDEGRKLRDEQREMGMIRRLLEIERRLAVAALDRSEALL